MPELAEVRLTADYVNKMVQGKMIILNNYKKNKKNKNKNKNVFLLLYRMSTFNLTS